MHLRLYRRHKEYREVFKRLFKYIEETKDENSIIFLGGDIVHNKTDMSPELVEETSKFLKSCADLLPTILICGNHDLNLSNAARLDALSPIVNSLNHPNLFYWKDSGVYKMNGVAFSVFSVFDEPEKWTLAKDIKSKYKIALHHGTVTGGRTDTGFDVGSHGTSIRCFDGFDISMLGDLHSCHFLDEDRTIGYSSSLIGQDFGESVDGHGILVWDLKSRKAEFVPIKNDYGFYTFQLINGKGDVPNNLPKNLRVRIKYENSTSEQIEDFVKLIGKKYRILELIKQRMIGSEIQSETKESFLGNSRNIEFQNKIIGEYLSGFDSEINQETIDEICRLNSETNKLLPISRSLRNVTWKPKKLEFSNMFSYGKDNVIDFENFNGVYGIMAPNHMGKSAALDILTFALYDKTTRATKATHIINNQSEEFYCKLVVECQGIDYFIERIGTRWGKFNESVRVEVNFWYYEDGEKVLLNGEDRDKTNYAIRDFFGLYDDFIMTSLSTQYDNQNFIEKSQKDRKELLYKFLDIFIYDDLFKIAKESSKEFQVLIRELERDDLHSKTSSVYSEIELLQDAIEEIDLKLNQARSNIKEKTNELVELNLQYQPVKEGLDINSIESNIISNSNQLKQIVEDLKDIKSTIEEKELELNENRTKFNSFKFDQSSNVFQDYRELQAKINDISKEISNIQNKINHCETKENQLKNHKYDPNCQFCIDNEFIKDAKISIELLPRLISEEELKRAELNQFQEESYILEKEIKTLEFIDSMKKSISTLESSIELLKEKESSIKFRGKTLNENLKSFQKQKSEYHENSAIILKNAEIISKIELIKESISRLEKEETIFQGNYRERYSEIERKKKEYESLNEKLDKYLDYIKKYRIYELYLQALSRDGVPYKILESVLPVIESEVNAILNQLVSFSVKLEAADEKNIHAYIVYKGNNQWPVELSSGMERFILSLAFRTSLSEITSLPKANFLAIDEGFGVLDSENILSMGKLFEYLKGQYDYLLIISHIDSMKDLVDKQIKIEKIDGFSKIIA